MVVGQERIQAVGALATRPQPVGQAVPYVPDLGSHLPALDGIRGLAILLVMIYHMAIMESATSLDRAFLCLTSAGWAGVDLFFVLSGFLITGILYDSKGGRGYFRNFYVRRTVRIFPLYYAVVFFSLVILPQFSHPKAASFGQIAGDEAWYWLYLSNYSIGFREAFRHGILDISWSLAIEEQFYLLWPAIVLLLGRRSLMVICAAMVGGALAFRIGLILVDANPVTIYVLTPSRVDALGVGAFIALAARDGGGVRRLVQWSRPLLLLSGAILAVLLAWDWLQWNHPLAQGAGYTGLAIFFGSLLVLGVGSPPASVIGRILSHAALTTLGRYSYGLYLFHLPVRALVRDTVFGARQFPTVLSSSLPGQFLFYGLAIALSLILALLSWHLYEKHFLKLKRFFPVDRETRDKAINPMHHGSDASSSGPS